MWVEAILAKDDLTALIGQMLPVTILLGDEGSLELTEPSDVALVADAGLRVVCKAKLRWPVLGIDVPVSLNSLTVLLRPEIAKNDGGESLVFKLEVEHADLTAVPTIIDNQITDRVNKELVEKHVELAWNFTETLSHVFELPESLVLVRALELVAAWGRVRVTEEAMVLVVSFHASIARGERPAAKPTAVDDVHEADVIDEVDALPVEHIPKSGPRATLAPMKHDLTARADRTTAMGWGIAALAAASALVLLQAATNRDRPPRPWWGRAVA